ncbi:hypothetical protein WICPIJ_004082 [Wickerhamomyces pijperi]|uniref:Uncharacterized protein n=1 Tax=Wickerhamomyces pijperi TaxID=599730 RepID=A0A9P8TN92_WICPI|nr:hypothetical protein WICPIJ_004082 [Wickerhamomyces pijperi]
MNTNTEQKTQHTYRELRNRFGLPDEVTPLTQAERQKVLSELKYNYEDIDKLVKRNKLYKEVISKEVGILSIKLIPSGYPDADKTVQYMDDRVSRSRVTTNITTVTLRQDDWDNYLKSEKPSIEFPFRPSTDSKLVQFWKKWVREKVITEETLDKLFDLKFVIVEIHEMSGCWTQSNSFNVIPIDLLFHNVCFNSETSKYQIIDKDLLTKPKTNIHIAYCSLLTNLLCDDTCYNCNKGECRTHYKTRSACNRKAKKDHLKLNHSTFDPEKEMKKKKFTLIPKPTPLKFHPLKTLQSNGYTAHPSCAAFKPLVPAGGCIISEEQAYTCPSFAELYRDQGAEGKGVNTGPFLGEINDAGLTIEDLYIKDFKISSAMPNAGSDSDETSTKHTFHIPNKLSCTIEFWFIPSDREGKDQPEITLPNVKRLGSLLAIQNASCEADGFMTAECMGNVKGMSFEKDVIEFLKNEKKFKKQSEKKGADMEKYTTTRFTPHAPRSYHSPYTYERVVRTHSEFFDKLSKSTAIAKELESLKKKIAELILKEKEEEVESYKTEQFLEDECGNEIIPEKQPTETQLLLESTIKQFHLLKGALTSYQITADEMKALVRPDMETLSITQSLSSTYEAQCHRLVSNVGGYTDIQRGIQTLYEALLIYDMNYHGVAEKYDIIRFKTSLNQREFENLFRAKIFKKAKDSVDAYLSSDKNPKYLPIKWIERFIEIHLTFKVEDPIIPQVNLVAKENERLIRRNSWKMKQHEESLKRQKEKERKQERPDEFWADIWKKAELSTRKVN